jgi:hypothetical protein
MVQTLERTVPRPAKIPRPHEKHFGLQNPACFRKTSENPRLNFSHRTRRPVSPRVKMTQTARFSRVAWWGESPREPSLIPS